MPDYLPDRYNPQMLTDEGYIETEELLFEMTAELESIYGQAYNEIYQKALKYLSWFLAADVLKHKKMEQGLIDEEEYMKQLK